MSTIIGSARIDENGHASGGQAGDQTGREVSTQDFYVHPKGWYIFRAKLDAHAEELAKAMIRACKNPNIGYDQSQRDGVVVHGTATKVKTECDCSSLVRRCIIEATGKDPGNIRTVSMPDLLPKTGLFEPTITYKSGTKLCTGDILCTCTSGHTVIVTSGADRKREKLRPAEPTLSRGSTGGEVKMLQRDLKILGYVGLDGAKLSIDGEFGKHTEHALKNFQKDQKIEVDGIYGKISAGKMAESL